MSSLKRKDAPGGTAPGKTERPNSDSRPSKRTKSDKKGVDAKSSSRPSKSSEPNPISLPTISRLKEEEPLFPRGGGSVLSPLEHKQIAIQAKQDVLFEQESNKGAKKTDRAPKKKRSKGQKDGKPTKAQQGDDSVRIESLNYKRLVKGSLVLGQVAEINSLDLVLALPNNLAGHVPITAISDILNERIAAEAEGDEDEDDNDDNQDDLVNLKELFRVGQYLRAYVTSTIEEKSANTTKPRRHIELSLRSEHTNTGLSGRDVVANSTVMATVASAEDHGFVMDLGITDSKVGGFLPRKEVDESILDSQLQPGAVILCLVTGKSANSKVAQLTTLQSKLGKVQNFASEATTINTFLPGSAVELLVCEVTNRGIAGKVMGSLDVTADLIHSGTGPQALDLGSKYKVGKKIKGRVICNFPTATDPKLGVSLLDHVLSLRPKHTAASKTPLAALSISSLVEQCTVTKVEPEIGLFVDVGMKGVTGFVHISRVKDGKVDMLSETSGPFKSGSVHRGRVVGYNALDGMFQLSFEKHILEQRFLRIEDIPVGEVVDGEIEKLVINQDGVSGLLVKLAEGIVGYAPELHLADIRLQHPEKKFREGLKVKARVLSTDPAKRLVRLTLKKTLVNSETVPIKSFEDLVIGMQVPGTIIKVLSNGAVVQFFGSLKGFLPVSEMSEAYIGDPKEHFRVGQVVNVHVLNFDAGAKKLFVSCKDPSAFGLEKQTALKKLKLGDLVSAKVIQKTEDDVFVELVDNSLKAMIPAGQLADKPSKTQSALKSIRVGQTLSNLVVLDKNEGRRFLALSKKPSLVKASQEGKLLTSLEEAKIGDLRQGFVRNVTVTAAFVQFAGQLIALLPKSKLPQEEQKKTGFGLEKYQSVLVKIASIDREHGRIVVASPAFEENKTDNQQQASSKPADKLENPIDEAISSMDDLFVGKMIKAKIVSIKSTQLNVRLADNLQGRVDITQVFDSWDEISKPKAPLTKFKINDTIDVRVLGIHDARNHRFLPISHRSSHSVLELSAKPSDLAGNATTQLSLDQLELGSTHLAFVNKVEKSALWANLSPNVRGRLSTLEISEDVSQLENLSSNFPVGSVLRVRVLAVNSAEGHLDLSARSSGSSANLKWEDVKQNIVLPGRITKINERQIIVQLSDIVSAPVHLIDISDDYDEASTMSYSKNNVLRVSVVDVDKSNKKIRLSTRPSRVLNSSLPVKDREITNASQLNTGEIIRGFVKNVSDKGLFVTLGGDVTAMVKISDLSDKFLKDWKDHYQVDQIVKGRIISVDSALGHVQMSLKSSVVDENYVPLIKFNDLHEGQVVTGTVRKVEEFGAFILVDGSANVSGLCHRSEMAEKAVEDARKLFNEGDVVKAIVLKIDQQKKRINFGLKPSYFEVEDEDSDMSSDNDEEAGATLLDGDDDDSELDEDNDSDEDMEDFDGTVHITGTDNDEDEDSDGQDEDVEMGNGGGDVGGLDAGGFNWSTDALDKTDAMGGDEAEGLSATRDKKKRRKPQIEEDKSGDLDAFGPKTAVDYERLLNRQPNSSALWIQYMAHQMQVSELAKAREVAERAINTINSAEETEKLNAWVAYLNLEVRFGNEETVDEVFKRACQVNDQQEVYSRLATIYIQDGKANKADELLQALCKKFGASSVDVWYNYAHWLHSVQGQPERARALLPRATQALPNQARLPLMTKFAALEFTSAASPNPELGRTMFEGLLATFPKRFDLWNQLLDHELAAKKPAPDAAVVRDVFERATKVKGLKARAAKKWFKRWADWEEEHGDAKSREKVRAKAAEWVRAREAAKGAKDGEEEDDDE